MSANQIGSFDLDRARRTYEELGPLTASDIYRLIRQSDKRRPKMMVAPLGHKVGKLRKRDQDVV